MKMMKKIFTVLAAGFFLCSCETEDDAGSVSRSSGTSGTGTVTVTTPSDVSDTNASGETIAAEATGSSLSEAGNKLYFSLTDSTVSSDNSTWAEITTKKAKFFDDTVTVQFTKDDEGNSTGLIKIDATDVTQGLALYFTGTQTRGGIKIQTSTDYETAVYLEDVSITSTNYPCIDITKGGAATVFLTGDNVLVDGRSYGTGYGEEYSTTEGATYEDDGETKECELSQNVVSEGSDSKGTLYCKGGLAVTGSGSLSVTQAYKNCIASKDGVLTIESGTITLKNYNSSSDTGKNGLFGGQGIIVSGGTVTFDGMGIVSTSDLRKANGFKTDDEDYPSSFVKLAGGSVNVTTYNGKGISAPFVYIEGGDNTFNVTGVTGFTGDDKKTGAYYDADGLLVKCTGSASTSTDSDTLYIKFAAEGIEGDSGVTVSGGNTIVSAADDGINVSATGGSLVISGGFLYVKAKGDGLDSNGNITVSGGVTVVSQTGGGNAPIDCGDGYKFTVTGSDAVVFAMGTSDMFSESIPSSTVSPMIYSKSLGTSSSSLGVNGIIALKSPQSYGAAILISPSLTSGTSYSFVKGGTVGGTLYSSDAGVYFPATVSGGSSVSATATTSSSSSGTGFQR
ncbi:MAG: carbohydrate-binding domain-containing protein [Treponema sp.]|nr:carbohydrate-binding domain-containing protein [Treponema sp.]